MRILFTTLCLLTVVQSVAQVKIDSLPITPLFETVKLDSTGPPRYKIRTFGWGYISSRDEFLSPLLYQGLAFGNQVIRQIYKPHKLIQTTSQFNVATLQNRVNNSTLTTLGGSLQYGQYFPLRKWSNTQTKVYAGGVGEIMLNLKLHLGNINNALAYDLAASVGVGGMVEHRFKLFNRQFMLTEQFTTPVASLLMRPPYAWPLPRIEEEGSKFSDVVQIGSFNQYIQLKNRVSLDFYVPQKRKRQTIALRSFRVSYEWNYSQINQPNKVQTGSHLLSFGSIIRL